MLRLQLFKPLAKLRKKEVLDGPEVTIADKIWPSHGLTFTLFKSAQVLHCGNLNCGFFYWPGLLLVEMRPTRKVEKHDALRDREGNLPSSPDHKLGHLSTSTPLHAERKPYRRHHRGTVVQKGRGTKTQWKKGIPRRDFCQIFTKLWKIINTTYRTICNKNSWFSWQIDLQIKCFCPF